MKILSTLLTGIFFLILNVASAQPKQEFDLYPPSGGPDAGSFYDPGNFETILNVRDVKSLMARNRSLLDRREASKIQGLSRDVASFFSASVFAGLDLADEDSVLLADLKQLSRNTLEIRKGTRYEIPFSEGAFEKIIENMGGTELSYFKSLLDARRRVHFVTEVVVVEDANLQLKWASSLGAEVRIIDVLRSIGRFRRAQDGTMISDFPKGTVIGYKSIEIRRSHKKMITKRLKSNLNDSLRTHAQGLGITVDNFITRNVTDDDEDMSFGFKVEFLNMLGEAFDSFHKSQPTTYVEQPSKIGYKKGKNMFFQGEGKTVSDDVYKVRVTVWAKTADGDCSKPWRHKNASQSIVYSYDDFRNGGEKVFKAWNCLDLKLRFMPSVL